MRIQEGLLKERDLLLLFVSYRTSQLEVNRLRPCLADLEKQIGYAVVVNDYIPGEPIAQLAAKADCFLTNTENLGYGRAVNRLTTELGHLPPYIGVLNIDLTWRRGTFEKLLEWMKHQPEVALAVPEIIDEMGTPQKLCKRNPTLLALCSRRFIPTRLKPAWLKRYDRWFAMEDHNYKEIFEVPYLSGCCMLIRSESYCRIGGFDERYFLYLEDADISRRLSLDSRCIHLPIGQVMHKWGRGNYTSLRLVIVNIISAWHYFNKWGWKLW